MMSSLILKVFWVHLLLKTQFRLSFVSKGKVYKLTLVPNSEETRIFNGNKINGIFILFCFKQISSGHQAIGGNLSL